MDISILLQTALLYVIRVILEYLDKEGLRLTPNNISYVQDQVMAKLQGSPLLNDITDQTLIQETIQGMLLDKLVLLPEDIIARSTWNATGPKSLKTRLPSPYATVVIHHTATDKEVMGEEDCKQEMKKLQQKQMREMNKNDIDYNFVLCGEGAVFEGTGWDVDTEHAPELGQKSLGVSFLGSSPDNPPTKASLKMLDLLLQGGVARGALSPTYQLFAHSQLVQTECPGHSVNEAIKKLSHWSGKSEGVKLTSKDAI